MKMKNILSLLTRNVFIGVLAGAATTAVLQSSSATTVMVIGFVTAGLMNPETGDQHYHRCEYRNDYNGAAGCVPDR